MLLSSKLIHISLTYYYLFYLLTCPFFVTDQRKARISMMITVTVKHTVSTTDTPIIIDDEPAKFYMAPQNYSISTLYRTISKQS